MHPLILLLIGVAGYAVYRGTHKSVPVTTPPEQGKWTVYVSDHKHGGAQSRHVFDTREAALYFINTFQATGTEYLGLYGPDGAAISWGS